MMIEQCRRNEFRSNHSRNMNPRVHWEAIHSTLAVIDSFATIIKDLAQQTLFLFYIVFPSHCILYFFSVFYPFIFRLDFRGNSRLRLSSLCRRLSIIYSTTVTRGLNERGATAHLTREKLVVLQRIFSKEKKTNRERAGKRDR